MTPVTPDDTLPLPEEPREDPWEPVDDLAAPDEVVPPPAEEPPETPSVEPWADVDDLDQVDVALAPEVVPESEDAWAPVDEQPVPMPPPAAAPPLPPPLPASAAPTKPRRSLPWRGVATCQAPELPSLLCTCDTTAAASTLLVAAWEPSEAGRVQFRLSDDGNWVDALLAPGDCVDLAIELDGESLTVRAALSVGAGHRGLRLGRDALAGRFLVDCSEVS